MFIIGFSKLDNTRFLLNWEMLIKSPHKRQDLTLAVVCYLTIVSEHSLRVLSVAAIVVQQCFSAGLVGAQSERGDHSPRVYTALLPATDKHLVLYAVGYRMRTRARLLDNDNALSAVLIAVITSDEYPPTNSSFTYKYTVVTSCDGRRCSVCAPIGA